MKTLKFDLEKSYGSFKVMNATNGGPWHKRHSNAQKRTNFEAYKAARMPYSRNHDSNLCSSTYGGPFAHDVSVIFPNFDADPCDPASYRFACTDEAVLVCLDAGTETFFRLGQSIENQKVKYNVYPPKDYHKWAVICEHIIMHYNEGWADGYELGIKYWEIWNEPDLYDGRTDAPSPTWCGTREQFFDFYEVAAKHLKARFPELKIGGPALSGKMDWGEHFIREMARREVPMDFFSWHIYSNDPHKFVKRAELARKYLDENGYTETESILNEWNYIKDWVDNFVYSIEMIGGIKGAAFNMACMSACQKSSVDMLMYYDTRPSAFCGIFDFYTARPRKPYYSMMWYGKFYDMAREVRCEDCDDPDLYTLCGVDEDGKVMSVVTYYTDDDEALSKSVCLDFGKEGEYEVYLLDKDHDGELVEVTGELSFDMLPNSCVLVREK